MIEKAVIFHRLFFAIITFQSHSEPDEEWNN